MSKYEKLPKWAQEEISILKNKVSNLEDSIQILSGDRHTRIYAKQMEMPNQWIDTFSTVCFETSTGTVFVSLETDFKLRVSNWIGQLIVMPQASNTVEVGIKT